MSSWENPRVREETRKDVRFWNSDMEGEPQLRGSEMDSVMVYKENLIVEMSAIQF